jgi:hypothetical protein
LLTFRNQFNAINEQKNAKQNSNATINPLKRKKPAKKRLVQTVVDEEEASIPYYWVGFPFSGSNSAFLG